MEILHFSHENPLRFSSERTNSDEKILRCRGCGEPIFSGSVYSCMECEFFLHKSCGELPKEINHNLHPQHSLVLHPRPPYHPEKCICRSCFTKPKENTFIYRCNATCEFSLDIICASPADMIIRHKSHNHPLLLIRRPSLFFCDACGEKHEGLSRGVGADHNQTQIPDDLKMINVIRLPPGDEFSSLVGHLTSPKDLLVSTKTMIEVNHLMNHEHPFILYNDQSSSSSSSTEIVSLLDTSKYLSEVPNCDLCFQQVSLPLYLCTQCNIFLHEKCSKLPIEVQHHPCHPEHPLILLPKSIEFFGLFNCNICELPSNGVCFCCTKCGFCVDPRCALLPSTMIHAAHPHHIFTLCQKFWGQGKCRCCLTPLNIGFVYACNACDFGLHAACALFPSTARHRFDRHIIKLIHNPSQGNSHEYYCEICELEVDQRRWFYHCVDCDRSFHIKCLPSLGYYSHVKYGLKFDDECHPHHPLTFVRLVEDALCDYCGRIVYRYDGLAFKCSECNAVFHFRCCKSYPK
ncbi:hypothetical protein ACH5RR_002872 [Cinchona calisaya]|uniref:Phorbol-ester/DAG-type domain-containing protein n=1 Tax=Cinchona calisaya TaxID=153742 RepID=A0ABD3ATK4_9GENT